MTDAQKFRFYFPAWQRCAKANNWRMKNTRLVAEFQPDPRIPERDQVWTAAQQIADSEHRGMQPDDFRKACHIVAVGQNKSSASLTNKEVNRAVALFDYLANPDDLNAVRRWLYPEVAERAGQIATIKRRAPFEYVARISQDVFGTAAWDSLPICDLQRLFRLLTQRSPAWPGSEPAIVAAEEPVDEENCPF